MKKRTAAFLSAAAFAAGSAVTIKLQQELKKDENKRKLYDTGNKTVFSVLRGISTVLPEPPMPHLIDFDSEGFMKGHETFIDKPRRGAKWSLGFACDSIIPDDISTGEYYLGGYLSIPPNRVEGVLDGLMFRCVALNDGSGRGTVVFGVLDAVGFSSGDVREIRNRLKDFAEENNIVSINISSTHCHSGIDTQGLWGDLKEIIPNNFKAVKNNELEKIKTGKNPKHMELIFGIAVDSIKRAVNSMTPGTLYRATVEGRGYARDKRPPNVVVDEITTFRFVPDDKDKRPTRLVMMAAHPTSFPDKNKMVSGDYPYHICNKLHKLGENAVFFQGPQAAVASNKGAFKASDSNEDDPPYKKMGEGVAEYLYNLPEETYEKVKPILNIRHKEVILKATNHLYHVLGKLMIANNVMVKTSGKKDDISVITEIGYAEIGENLKLALVPGELMPEILKGGFFNSSEAYNRVDWAMPSLTDIAGEGLVGIGLCNDSIGYIVPDNDFGSIFAPLHYEESVSVGENTASTIVTEFMKLVEEVKK